MTSWNSTLDRNTPLKRSKGLNPVNRERKKRRFKRHFHSEEHAEWMTGLACEVTGTKGEDIHQAHVRRSRAAGGTWEDTVPLRADVHRDYDSLPAGKFQKRWGRTKKSVAESAERYAEMWEQRMEER